MSKLKLAIMLRDGDILELDDLEVANESSDGKFLMFTDKDGTILTVCKDTIAYYKVFEKGK